MVINNIEYFDVFITNNGIYKSDCFFCLEIKEDKFFHEKNIFSNEIFILPINVCTKCVNKICKDKNKISEQIEKFVILPLKLLYKCEIRIQRRSKNKNKYKDFYY